jgi:hypothetical protein
LLADGFATCTYLARHPIELDNNSFVLRLPQILKGKVSVSFIQ